MTEQNAEQTIQDLGDTIQVASISVIESQERANIDMLIATAKKYPRDISRVKRSMEAMATLDEETAESCNYHLERNGKSIDGPSVRMAEIAVAAYQNIRCGSRVIANDGKVITGQAFCHDLENNTFIAWETQRRITDKMGRIYTEDMQVVTGNAASAIAFRNAVFKVIPGALIRSVAEKARAVAVGDIKTLSQRRTRALNKFASLGIRHERVLEFLGKPSIEQIDIADVETLFGVFTAIREGTTSIEEQFPPKAKVVSPNFAEPQPAQEPTPTEPKRRGRPPKQAAETPAETPTPPPDAREPAPSPNIPAQPQSPPESRSTQPQETLFGSADPAAEIVSRLKAAKIPQEKFVELMLGLGFIDAEVEDIRAGYFGIEKCDSDLLNLALKDWASVIKKLGGAANA